MIEIDDSVNSSKYKVTEFAEVAECVKTNEKRTIDFTEQISSSKPLLFAV